MGYLLTSPRTVPGCSGFELPEAEVFRKIWGVILLLKSGSAAIEDIWTDNPLWALGSDHERGWAGPGMEGETPQQLLQNPWENLLWRGWRRVQPREGPAPLPGRGESQEKQTQCRDWGVKTRDHRGDGEGWNCILDMWGGNLDAWGLGRDQGRQPSVRERPLLSGAPKSFLSKMAKFHAAVSPSAPFPVLLGCSPALRKAVGGLSGWVCLGRRDPPWPSVPPRRPLGRFSWERGLCHFKLKSRRLFWPDD